MLSTDRAEFEKQLAILFGGFPQFLTPPRIEAYWRGLQKMPLSLFIRCVDQVLGEQGEEKLPTINSIWKISKELRAASVSSPKKEPERIDGRNNFERFADHLMLNYFLRRGGPSRASLAEILSEKRRLTAQYFDINTEDRVTPEEFQAALHKAWDAKWQKQLPEEFNADRRQLQRIGCVTGTEPILPEDRARKIA